MEVIFDEKTRSIIIKLEGDIDHHSAEKIRVFSDREYKKHKAKNIIFNFENVSFMDSSGIGMIIGRYKLASLYDGKFAACCVNESLMKIFKISGVTKLIKIFETQHQAQDAVQKGAL